MMVDDQASGAKKVVPFLIFLVSSKRYQQYDKCLNIAMVAQIVSDCPHPAIAW